MGETENCLMNQPCYISNIIQDVNFLDYLFSCVLCKFRTASKASLRRHMLSHTEDGQFHCRFCNFGNYVRMIFLKTSIQDSSSTQNTCFNLPESFQLLFFPQATKYGATRPDMNWATLNNPLLLFLWQMEEKKKMKPLWRYGRWNTAPFTNWPRTGHSSVNSVTSGSDWQSSQSSTSVRTVARQFMA